MPLGGRAGWVGLGVLAAQALHCGHDEGCGGCGRVVLGGWQDTCVGVGGQRDARVAELVLDGFEISTGGVGEAGRAVAEVVQADRGQAGFGPKSSEAVGGVAGPQWQAVGSGGDVAGLGPVPGGRGALGTFADTRRRERAEYTLLPIEGVRRRWNRRWWCPSWQLLRAISSVRWSPRAACSGTPTLPASPTIRI